MNRRGVLAALAGLAASSLGRGGWAAGARRPVVLPLSFAVATLEGAPVVDEAWLAARLTAAAALLQGSGVGLARGKDRRLAPDTPFVETAEHRDALALAGAPGVINVDVVALLRDIDTPPDERRGVHWRARREPSRRCVVLSRIGSPMVLAHELGHFLGLGHSRVRNNVMSYEHDEGVEPFFERWQNAVLRRNAEDAIARGELVAARG